MNGADQHVLLGVIALGRFLVHSEGIVSDPSYSSVRVYFWPISFICTDCSTGRNVYTPI